MWLSRKGAGPQTLSHPQEVGGSATPVTERSLMEPHLAVGAWLCTCHRGWQGYPEGGENILAAETSTMTFKEQLGLNETGEQIPAPSSRQRQESQQGTDRFIMFLGAVPLHVAGDKVTPCSQSTEMGWDGYSK